jgi:hypothetical protein
MQETRSGEPPLTGRELRLLMAMLDANGNGKLSRDEFERGLKECRELEASMAAFEADPSAVVLEGPVWVSEEAGVPTWAQFLDGMKVCVGCGCEWVCWVVVGVLGCGEGKGRLVCSSECLCPPHTLPLFSFQLPSSPQILHNIMVEKADFVEHLWKTLDSRGKGKLDMIEIRQVRGGRGWRV